MRVERLDWQDVATERPYDKIAALGLIEHVGAAQHAAYFSHVHRLLAPGGTLSYFEYMYVRPVRRLVSKSAEKQRLADLDRILGAQLDQHRVARDWVFVNAPPAWVQHLRRRTADSCANHGAR